MCQEKPEMGLVFKGTLEGNEGLAIECPECGSHARFSQGHTRTLADRR